MDVKQIQQVYTEYVRRRSSPAKKEIPSQAVIKPKKKKSKN